VKQELKCSVSGRYEVRAARVDDCVKLADLAGQLGYPCVPEQVRLRIMDMVDTTQCATLIAEGEDGSIVGWIGVFIFRSVATDAYAQINGLVINEGDRGRGLGEMLLNAAEQWAREHNCSAILVLSNVIRDRAHSFYRNRGYLQVKTQHSFRKNLSS
jgi:GNAT superfamily N-acetyltransferase